MKILVIGELCTDKFVYGKITRLCPEAPVPIFNPTEHTVNPGMAGNVVENLKALDDAAEITFWHQEEEILKQRIVDAKSNQMIVRIDEGENFPISPLSDFRRETIIGSDIVIVSDYDKGFLSDEVIEEIGNLSTFSIIDTKRRINEKILKAFTFVKLNESESLSNPEFSNFPNVIVTLGKDGAKVGDIFFPQFSPRETIDVSGAGDTFISAFSLSYFKTQDLEKSVNFANSMAGKVVSKRGVATP
jgi:bifunctional ADP-heptose synthase (sugar kinase/adenylyltransferase)